MQHSMLSYLLTCVNTSVCLSVTRHTGLSTPQPGTVIQSVAVAFHVHNLVYLNAMLFPFKASQA